MDENSLEQDIATLSNHQAFARFISAIHDFREECIAELHKASTEEMQQISGRMLSYDQILQIVDYEALKRKHSSVL